MTQPLEPSAPSNDTRSALEQVVTVIDAAPCFAMLESRFGIAPHTFAGLCLVQSNPKVVHIVNADHQPPLRPAPDTIGMPFMRIKMIHPKLTTAAVMRFGNAATQNVLASAEKRQIRAFIARQDIEVSAEEAANFTGRGYVLIGYRNMMLGMGFYAPYDRPGQTVGVVQSLFPKAWSVASDRNPFGEADVE
ncbi:MAG: hypothetical protein H0U74_14710 [Bradymonadaceae bacterium]|nr:hypothetical protein [Lujinxingiaceae bacterium]